ncbi:MAG: TldD/PmbA family protein [Anaerolineales bacterium]
MIDEKVARNLSDAILKRCKGNPAEVTLITNDSALTRFANNIIHQNVAERDAEATLRYFIGKQFGTASTNCLDEAGLDDLVERAKSNAKASPEDPNYPGLPEPETYQHVVAWDQYTAYYSAEKRAQAVGAVCQMAVEKGLNASGAFSTGSGELVVANTQGVFTYHTQTNADFQTVVMSHDSSGRAQESAWKVDNLAVEALGKEAIETALRGHNPLKIDPGEYTVVLEHYVTEDLLSSLNFYGMGAQALQEGRSWMNDRIGKRVMSPLISIWDDGLDVHGSPLPFDFEGVPKQRVDIVKDGVIIGPVYDRYSGAKMGKPSTGHATPIGFRSFGPLAMNLFMKAGSSSVEDMIASTEKGLYINRFWYTRLVHPRDCVITGMTRDGVFMIEDGQVTYPVKNLRYTMPYVTALANVEAVGKAAHLLVGEFGEISVHVPALKINGFNFTGSTV